MSLGTAVDSLEDHHLYPAFSFLFGTFILYHDHHSARSSFVAGVIVDAILMLVFEIITVCAYNWAGRRQSSSFGHRLLRFCRSR